MAATRDLDPDQDPKAIYALAGADPDECAPTNSPSNIDADGAVFGCVSGVIINLCASIITS